MLVQTKPYVSDISRDFGCILLRCYLNYIARLEVRIADSCPKNVKIIISTWY